MADAKKPSRVDAYNDEFTAKITKALKEGTTPWQKPWKPGERSSPRNFSTAREYRGGNAVYLAVEGTGKGYADPRWGGYRQIAAAGGHVRKGEKGTPIMYVEYTSKTLDKDAAGQPRLNEDGHPHYLTEQRDRPLVRIHTVFNVEQTEGLNLKPLAKDPAPEWHANNAVADLVKHSEREGGPKVAHEPGDRAYYNKGLDRVVLPDPSQFPEQTGYSHTALHEIAHATGHESRLNRPTLTSHGGFGSETYAREELRAEMGAMMAGDQLGVGHEPRHGHAYVASWVKALENDPHEIRHAATDAQKAADWIVERARAIERRPPTIEREAGRLHDGRGPDVPLPPPPVRAPEPAPTVGAEREAPGPSR